MLIVRHFVQLGERYRRLLNFHRENVLRSETRIDAQQPLETSNQQSSADQRYQCERNLRNDESAAQIFAATRCGGGAAAFFQHGREDLVSESESQE